MTASPRCAPPGYPHAARIGRVLPAGEAMEPIHLRT
jgi:hypothetical protein